MEENVHLPLIFTLLTRIPCHNYCLVNQALYLVGESITRCSLYCFNDDNVSDCNGSLALSVCVIELLVCNTAGGDHRLVFLPRTFLLVGCWPFNQLESRDSAGRNGPPRM